MSTEGSVYFNYKMSHYIVLVAMVNAGYNSLFVDVGTFDSVVDSGIWKGTPPLDKHWNKDFSDPEP